MDRRIEAVHVAVENATCGLYLHRPAILPVPGFALKAALGEAAGALLGGQAAVPARLSAAGFEFRHPDLGSALDAIVSPAQIKAET